MEIAYIRADEDGALQRDFQARFEAVRPRLLRICATVVGATDAEDLVQETYLRALERLGQLREPRLLEAWLARIALNEALSLRRNQGRLRARLPQLAPQDEPSEAIQPDADLRELVDGLPIRERACVVLYYGYGYRLGEIAQLLNVSAINARTILFRARRRLRRQLREVSDDASA